MTPRISELKQKFVGFLRFTERYTKTDMVYVTREGSWSLLSQVVSSLASAAAVIVLANILPKESFGQYRFVLSLIPVLVIFALPGISTALMRSAARGARADFPKVVETEIKWGFLGSLASLLIAAYYFSQGDHVLSLAFALTAALVPFIQPFSVYSAYYKGKQNFKLATIYDSISLVFQAVLLVGAALVTRNILVVIGAFLAGRIIPSVFFYVKTLRDEGEAARGGGGAEDGSDDTIRYGKRLTTTQIMSTIAGSIDKLLVGYFLGLEVLAVYSIALTIPSNAILLFNVIPRIAFPKFSKNSWGPEERAKIIRKLMIFLAALIVPVALYALLVPVVLPFIFKDYRASIPTALVLSFLILVSPLNAVIDQVMQARKFVGKIIWSQTVTVVVFVAAFFAVYRVLGANPMDAAIALIVSEVAQFLVGIFFIRK